MSPRRYWWNEDDEEKDGASPPLTPHADLNQPPHVVTGRWISSTTSDNPPPSMKETLSFWQALKEEAHRTESNQ